MPREFEPIVKQIDQQMINDYADVIGDYNPIHVDEEFAKTTQFGGTIAHGSLVMAFGAELMTRDFGVKWLASGSMRARFKAAARPGDTVTVSGREHSEGVYKLEWRNQNNELLITASARVSV